MLQQVGIVKERILSMNTAYLTIAYFIGGEVLRGPCKADLDVIDPAGGRPFSAARTPPSASVKRTSARDEGGWGMSDCAVSWAYHAHGEEPVGCCKHHD